MIYIAHLDDLFFSIPSLEKQAAFNRLLSTWQFHLYHKADNELG